MFLSIPEQSSPDPDEFTTSETLEKLIDIIRLRELLRIFRQAISSTVAGWSMSLIGYDASTLGSPPPMIASANRMSPAGISMFYGCDEIPTVVAEIGSHTAKKFAVIGSFETTRPLQMLNLTPSPRVPNHFDPQQREHYYELLFLHEFTRDLIEPVVLDGREHIEYVPTQVVTEYTRWLPAVAIDGILFTSAQNGGTSCVIFCGPEGCADEGKETDKTMLRLKKGSVQSVRIVASPTGL